MRKLDGLLWRLVDAVILVAVVGMVCLIALQVGSRLMGASVPWTEELSRFLFIWTVWLGIATGFRYGQHPALSFLYFLAPRGLKPVLRVIPAVAAVMLFSIVTWHGWALLSQQVRFGELSPILQVGMWLTTLPLVLGSGLAVLGAIVHTATDDIDDVTEALPEGARE
ncbi:TRAP transporter small permease [Rhodobacter sp. NSM]|uniref:TRAP transporter small permease n=1 Tax=Rhodobacter sp. NSM TaxID=3457501 RepID=UPI003FD07830